MLNRTDTPKIFISYSWNPIQNKIWVIELANRLMSDGVHVILDVWDFKEGHDKYTFMEKMVNDANIKRVLMICNKEYAEKANSRTGGVGTESMIISPEVYRESDQEKFIPILKEFDENNKPYLPTFVESRKYLDFSDYSVYEEKYEELLRNIFDKPKYQRPPLGTQPTYLTSDEPILMRTSNKVKRIKNALIAGNTNIEFLFEDYIDDFFNSLNDFHILDFSENELPLDEIIYNNIMNLKILRNDFIDFYKLMIRIRENYIAEITHKIFQRLINFLNSHYEYSKLKSYTNENLCLDHFRFVIWESFLYVCTILIEHERFDILCYLLKNKFIRKTNDGEKVVVDYDYFNFIIESLDKSRNKRLKLNKISLSADLLKTRADLKDLPFSDLVQTDLLLYYISLFHIELNHQRFKWFPQLSIYNSNLNIALIKKAKSQIFFEKIKCLFYVNDVNELKLTLDEITKNENKYSRELYYHIPPIKEGFSYYEIGSI